MLAKTQPRPFSIRMFVPDGDPDGLRIVEKSNWTGVGVVFNRTNYKQVFNRDEFGRTGVYVLVGDSGESSLPTVYIGEGDPVKDRLNHHYATKDFWNWAVFFTTKDNSLNKAHVQHLEAALLMMARDAKQCRIDNTQNPLLPTLSEADVADMASFLLETLNVLPLLGLGIFEKAEAVEKRVDSISVLYIESKNIKASGFEDAKGFIVVKGDSRLGEVGRHRRSTDMFGILRKDLLGQGIIVEDGSAYVFTQDQVFNSPSTAAGVVLGRTANGRIEWKDGDGRTLKESAGIYG